MPRLLYLVHDLPPEEHSGTPLLAYGYAVSLARQGFDVTVAHSSFSTTSWDLTPVRREGESFDRVPVPTTSYSFEGWSAVAPSDAGTEAPAATRAFVDLLRRIDPHVLHIVNNVNLPLSWPELAHAQGIPVIRSVTCAEDLCGLIAPVSPRSGPGGYCHAPLTPDGCARCMEANAAARPDEVPEPGPGLLDALRRKRARSAAQYLRVFDRMIFATDGFRHYFEETLPLDPKKVRMIPTGIDVVIDGAGDGDGRHGIAPAPLAGTDPANPVVFCLAAMLHPTKGIPAVVEAFTSPELLGRDDYRLVLFGGGNEELISDMLATNTNVSWHGSYQSGELPGLLTGVDVGLSTSYFETFHRVTREYLLAGRPVIGSQAFGIPDIIRPGRNGLLFDHRDPGSLARAVITLLDDRQLLATLAAGARATVVKSIDEEAEDLAELYREVMAESRLAPIPIP